jgi:arylsulfatase
VTREANSAAACRLVRLCCLGLAPALFLACAPAVAQPGSALDRTVLPIPEPKPPVYTEFDVRGTKAPPRFEVKAPSGAPNVLIVPIDDVGFGAAETFGGLVARRTA